MSFSEVTHFILLLKIACMINRGVRIIVLIIHYMLKIYAETPRIDLVVIGVWI